VVSPPLRRAGPPWHRLRSPRRRGARVEPLGAGALRARLQPILALGLPAGTRAVDLPYARLPAARGEQGRGRGQRQRGLRLRDLQGPAARAAARAAAAAPTHARDQPPVTGARRRRGAEIPGSGQGQRGRQRRRHRALRRARLARRRCGRRHDGPRDRPHRPRPGARAAARRAHHARRGARRTLPVRHPRVPRGLLQPVPRRRLRHHRRRTARLLVRDREPASRRAGGTRRAAGRGDRAGTGAHAACWHRRGRRGVPRGRPRRADPVLRRQRSVQLRRRSAARGGLRSLRGSSGQCAVRQPAPPQLAAWPRGTTPRAGASSS